LSQRLANLALEGTGKSRAAVERHSLFMFFIAFSYAFGHLSTATQLRFITDLYCLSAKNLPF
jgi:hypothetical protein